MERSLAERNFCGMENRKTAFPGRCARGPCTPAIRRTEGNKMSLFVIDEEKCRRDGLCVETCPLKIVELKEGHPIPTPVEDADSLCINCGHCVSICPYGAFTLKTMTPDQCPEIREDLKPTPEQAAQFLRARRSIRIYKDQPVEKEVITGLIDLARYAPSGSNRQPIEWLVVHDKKDVREIAEMVIDWMRYLLTEKEAFAKSLSMDRIVDKWEEGDDLICRRAPHLLITHSSLADISAPQAGTIALTYFDLAASAHGIGVCWAGYVYRASAQWPPLQKFLSLPEGHGCFGAMMVGYPNFKYKRMPLRNEPRITWL